MTDLKTRDGLIGAPRKWMTKYGVRELEETYIGSSRPTREFIFSFTVRIPNPVYRLYWKKVEASRKRQRQAILDA